MRQDEDDDDEHDSSETKGTTSTIALDWGSTIAGDLGVSTTELYILRYTSSEKYKTEPNLGSTNGHETSIRSSMTL
jgi:hypothetical protein